MTTINIENRPISIQLNASENVTVPIDEIWKVEIAAYSSGVSTIGLTINNVQVGITRSEVFTMSMVLVGNDKIGTLASTSAFITGFVINKN